MGRANEDHEAAKSHDESENDFWHRPVSTGTNPIQDYEPEGDRGDEEGCNAGGHDLLGPTDAAVSDEEQQEADNRSSTPIRSCWADAGVAPENGIKNKSRGEMAKPRQNQWREGFDADPNGEIGRTPDEVNSNERHDDERSGSPRFMIGVGGRV